MYSSKNLILYEIDNSGSWTQYTEEVVIDEPGTHIVTAVSSDSDILSENATAVYKVAAVAKVSTHLAASRAPAIKSHDLCPRNCLKLTLPTPQPLFLGSSRCRAMLTTDTWTTVKWGWTWTGTS